MNNIVIAFASSDDKVLTNDHSVTKIDNFQMVVTVQTTRCTDKKSNNEGAVQQQQY